jgi:NitT/TauT family transport system substrate-binding protein
MLNRTEWPNYSGIVFMRRRTVIKSSAVAALATLTSLGLSSCKKPTQKTNESSLKERSKGKAPLKVALVPWLGWGRAKIAEKKGFFEAEGVTVEHIEFQTVSEVNTTLLADQADLAWLVAADLAILAEQVPSLKFVMACDYSGDVDAVIGRAIADADEAKQMTFAREDVPYEIVFMAKYLETLGLKESDVKIAPLTVPDGAAALLAGNVDVVAAYEPFIINTLKEDPALEVLFTAKDTNIIVNGLSGHDKALTERREEVLAYMRALNKAVDFAQENPDEANAIIGEWVGLKPEEVADLLTKVELLDLEANKAIAFAPDHELNVINSIDSAAPILVAAGKVKTAVEGAKLVDDSFVKAL